MNICMIGKIESGLDTLRARVTHNMEVKGGNKFVPEWHLADLGDNKFSWFGNITDMEAMGAMMSDPEEVAWDEENGAVYKVYSMVEMTD